MSNLKCSKIGCSEFSIIRFVYDVEKRRSYCYCLKHLIEFIEYIKDNEFFHLLTNIKKIIPIYLIKEVKN